MKKTTFFLLFLIWNSSFAQTITRIPYLQKPTSTSMTVRWRTDQSIKGKVYYTKEGTQQSLSVTEEVPVFNHEVEIIGLEPNTKYFYQIATESKVLQSSEKMFFTTLPSKDLPKPVRIWAMGDFGDFTKKSYVDNQNAVYDSFKKLNKDQAIDLWMWLGDNAYCCGTDTQYQLGVFEYFSADFFAKTPIVSVPGNHEYYYASGSEATRQIPYFDIISTHTKGEGGGVPSGNKAYYSFDIGNIHFIALDSYGLDDGKKLYNWESPQYQWLLQDLEENSKKENMWTVVYLHHPPYTKRSHDSDTEQDLGEIRRFLVHKFDEYKVDLVLSGHSHVYERSYLIQNHRGNADSFNAAEHVVQNTKALYTADSPPIVNKTIGTVYTVVGSAGRLDWNGKNEPHPTSVYSNKDVGGSLLLTIEDNRLDGQWICADGSVRDNFTMFKKVNAPENYTVSYGKEIELKAPWPGTYRWSEKQENKRSLKKRFFSDQEITVTDSLGYLIHKFNIKVGPKPSVKPTLQTANVACSGGQISGSLTVVNENAADWSYTLLLSNKSGSFENATEVGIASNTNFSFSLPQNIEQGAQYKLKAIIKENPYFENLESSSFTIYKPISAQILQEGTIPFSPEIQIEVKAEGSLPAVLKISSIKEVEINNPETSLKANPTGNTTYYIESIKNICGLGKVIGEGFSVESALGTEPLKNIKIYPNPGYGKYEIESVSSREAPSYLQVIDVSGRIVYRKTLIGNKEKIEVDSLPDGVYIFKVSKNKQATSLKVIKG
jgi:3',5'-cyclic AMP phosphodiesterase CpdA